MISTKDAMGNETTYAYDQLGRPAQVRVNPGDPLLGPTFDKVGNVVTDTDLLGNVTHYTYDARNRLTSTVLPQVLAPNGTMQSPVYGYAYNAAGDLVAETDPLGNVTAYGYDNLHRRTSASLPDLDTGGSRNGDAASLSGGWPSGGLRFARCATGRVAGPAAVARPRHRRGGCGRCTVESVPLPSRSAVR
jgi:YD repeat-containing protein